MKISSRFQKGYGIRKSTPSFFPGGRGIHRKGGRDFRPYRKRILASERHKPAFDYIIETHMPRLITGDPKLVKLMRGTFVLAALEEGCRRPTLETPLLGDRLLYLETLSVHAQRGEQLIELIQIQPSETLQGYLRLVDRILEDFTEVNEPEMKVKPHEIQEALNRNNEELVDKTLCGKPAITIWDELKIPLLTPFLQGRAAELAIQTLRAGVWPATNLNALERAVIHLNIFRTLTTIYMARELFEEVKDPQRTNALHRLRQLFPPLMQIKVYPNL